MNLLPLLISLALLQPTAPPPDAGAPISARTQTTDVDAATTPAQASPLDPAQAAPGRIDDLLGKGAAAPPAPDGPVVTAPPSTSAPAPPPPNVPKATPGPLRPRGGVAGPTAPAFIDDPAVAPDGPPTDRDASYQNRLLNTFQASQGRQGPLDGPWTVATAQGELFRLQLTDPGAGEARIEGAWLNLQRSGGPASGFIDQVTREGDALLVRFFEGNAAKPTEIRLKSGPNGEWIGQTVSAQGSAPVIMRRGQGVEIAARAAPYVEPEPQPERSAGPARACPKPVKARKGHRAAAQPRGCATAKSHSPSKRHSASKPKKTRHRR